MAATDGKIGQTHCYELQAHSEFELLLVCCRFEVSRSAKDLRGLTVSTFKFNYTTLHKRLR